MAEKGLSFLLRKAPTGATVTFTNATNLVNYTSHGASAGDPVILTNSGGALPAELTASKVYYIGDVVTNGFTLHLTKAAGVAGSSDVAFTDDGTGTSTGKLMTTIAGMRTTSFSINGETVDVTNKDSTSQARELLPAAGVSSMSLSAAGVFQDNSNVTECATLAIARTLETFLLEFESGDGYWGLFQVGSVEQGGEHNGETTYSIALESSDVATLNVNT